MVRMLDGARGPGDFIEGGNFGRSGAGRGADSHGGGAASRTVPTWSKAGPRRSQLLRADGQKNGRVSLAIFIAASVPALGRTCWIRVCRSVIIQGRQRASWA